MVFLIHTELRCTVNHTANKFWASLLMRHLHGKELGYFKTVLYLQLQDILCHYNTLQLQ